jgi:hypothetical protein
VITHHRLLLPQGETPTTQKTHTRFPYLTGFPARGDRAIVCGLRLLPVLQGLPTWTPEPGTPAPPIRCPHCDSVMSLEHALSCAGFAPIRTDCQLDLGLNLTGLLRSCPPSLPCFFRKVRSSVVPKSLWARAFNP